MAEVDVDTLEDDEFQDDDIDTSVDIPRRSYDARRELERRLELKRLKAQIDYWDDSEDFDNSYL